MRLQKEAKRRDHRKIGKDLNLFSIQQAAGGGLVFWHPKGASMRMAMEDYWKSAHLEGGYELLNTPHMASIELWKTSGHFDFYKDDMFAQMEVEGEQVAIDTDGVATLLNEADSVIIIPGYGMAVAQAQQNVAELTRRLRAKGKTVRFAIHPVAGRLPGHMNVLLAEAKVPYDIVMEMDEINDDFPTTDVAIVIGSNDIVNPAAQDDPNSPIAGMPVLECWKAKQVFVSKRGQGTGYSGIENPLFFKENTRMFYGDAKASLDALLSKIS